MVISKNSKDKRSLYLKYVNNIIKSLEENPETWRMIICGGCDKKRFYVDDFFNLVINLEEKVVNIFRRATRVNEEPKLLIDTIGPFKIRKKEVEFIFNGLMISDISLLSELICHYDEDDVFAGLFSMEWENEEKLKSELITKLKMFLFDAIFSDHFYEDFIGFIKKLQRDNPDLLEKIDFTYDSKREFSKVLNFNNYSNFSYELSDDEYFYYRIAKILCKTFDVFSEIMKDNDKTELKLLQREVALYRDQVDFYKKLKENK